MIDQFSMKLGGHVLTVEDLADLLVRDLVPRLSDGPQAFIRSDLMEVDPDMIVDDCMQFALLDGIELPADFIDQVEDTVRHAGYDPELLERTLGWIAQHRERNRAAA